MKHLLGIFISSSIVAGAALASDSIIYETEKAFDRSQALRGEGVAAFRTGNVELALEKLQAALKERPNHPVLLNYLAYIGAQQSDEALTKQAAEGFLKVGLQPPANILGAMAERTPDNKALYDKLEQSGASKGKPEIAFTVGTEAGLVEGVAIKDASTAFLSTVATGTIFKKENDTLIPFFKATELGARNFFGIAYSKNTDSLFATYATLDNYECGTNCPTGVIELDATTGKLRRNAFINSNKKQPHQIADIFIGPDDEVLLSDAQGKAVYKLKDNKLDEIEALPTSMSPQGIVKLGNGDILVADYGRGIWLLKNGKKQLLGTPDNLMLIGLDGLYLKNGELIAIQNGTNPNRILSLTLANDLSHIKSYEVMVQGSEIMTEPTLGTFYKDSFYFVGNSQWAKYPNGHNIKEGMQQEPTNIAKIKY
ncbi:hypothetical protein KFE96_02450 [Kordiimonas sp. SCSIO 12603]|uniref:tetratricopeptide repeat protein n=1 Tax=Kordiimonas sp. SCSIO 12603 TaxID=2829596 RepID=UPI002107E9BF|nr:tetratricopeptide repeat protein [Kordiimonas sp. SCSIO 12603]UTW59189.1 hypothetical protein KFE96_02450 [Kordiimonas sp. SCSIO 12603]